MTTSITPLRKIAANYWKISLWLLCALSLLGVLYLRHIGELSGVQSIVVAVIFHLITAVAYGQAWLRTAEKAPAMLPKFYIIASALRLFAAAATVLIYCVIARNDTQQIKIFAIVFITFYIVMLIFESLYFARKGKNIIQSPTVNDQTTNSPNDQA